MPWLSNQSVSPSQAKRYWTVSLQIKCDLTLFLPLQCYAVQYLCQHSTSATMATMMTRRNVAAQAKKSGTSFNKPKVGGASGPPLFR
jgi:hypothetical protein